MDQQDGAISGRRDDETARSGPHGVDEDAGARPPQEAGYRAAAGDDSPTAGTVLPGDEDSVRQLGLDAIGSEGEQETFSPNAVLDLAAGRSSADAAQADADSGEIASGAADANELAQGTQDQA